MDDNKKIKSRLFFILLLTLFLTVVSLFQVLIYPSMARYIKQERDRLVARYTALYLTTNGEGKTISLEKKGDTYEGFMSFDLMNYKDEDVTRRDIVYTIDTLVNTDFYDSTGNKITKPEGKDLYVLDLWGEPVNIGDDTYKYKVSMESVVEEGKAFDLKSDIKFTYKKNWDQDIGSIHSLNIKVEREADYGELNGVENISIIVQILKPYKQVFVINVSLSNYLIMFSETDYSQFELDFKRVYVQSANIYRYFKGTDTLKKYPNMKPIYEISSKALKVVISWDENYRINLHDVDDLHIGIGDYKDNIRIDKPFIDASSITRTSLTIYVPQGSDFYLEFYKINQNIYSQIYAYVEVLSGNIGSNESSFIYRPYDNINFDAYDYGTNNKYTIVQK